VNAPTRPVLRWHGGKWKLAPWIISHFPKHRVYVEPFGGAASVLLRKAPSYAEIYNDLDDDVVNLFRVLQDRELAGRLLDLLHLTPFARTEFELAYQPAPNSLERARRLVIRSFMGFGSDGHNVATRTGFRGDSNRSGTTPARDWTNYPDCLVDVIERFAGVVVESRNAIEVSQKYDDEGVLHYFDPPYVWDTRSDKSRKSGGRYHAYAHELDEGGHTSLLSALRELRGNVVLSGYATKQYDAALLDWRRIEVAALADGARPRTEVLWLNPACAAALDRERSDLFSAGAA
jgi:DNA adenine methylase